MKYGKTVKVSKVTKGDSKMEWTQDRNKDQQRNDDNIFEKDLSIYNKEFEKRLIEQTVNHYKTWSIKWKEENPVNIYIRIIRDHIRLEDNNSDAFLEDQTKPKMTEIVLKECIEL